MTNMRGASTVLKHGPGAHHRVHDAYTGLPSISTSRPTSCHGCSEYAPGKSTVRRSCSTDDRKEYTCVLAECSQDIGRGVPHIGLPKGAHKALVHSFVLTCLSCPALQKLGSNALVVSTDERVGVVDGGTVYWEPTYSASAPAAEMPLPFHTCGCVEITDATPSHSLGTLASSRSWQ